MKKIVLLATALMLIAGTSFGAAPTYDINGDWNITVPYWSGTIGGLPVVINTSLSTATLAVNMTTGIMSWTMTSGAMLDTDGNEHPYVSTDAAAAFPYLGIDYYGSQGTPIALTDQFEAAMAAGLPFIQIMESFQASSAIAAAGYTRAWIQLTPATEFPLPTPASWLTTTTYYYASKATVPVPAAFGLLALGLVGLVGLRRKMS